MNKLFVLFLTLALTFITSAGQANIIPQGNGTYEIKYEFTLGGTLNGSDVTDIFIFETNGTNSSIDYPFIASSEGPSTISHIINFKPTLALLLGLDQAPSDSGLADQLVVFMNNERGDYAIGKIFGDVFPAVDGEPRIGHNALAAAVSLFFENGDSAAYTMIEKFLTIDGYSAAFDPENSFRVIEFSVGNPIDVVPEPATMFLLGTGLVGVAGAARRRKKKNQA